MNTFRFKARNINNGKVEVSNGPLVVEFDIYGIELRIEKWNA